MSKLTTLHARPATMPFSSRADARYIATLAAFWLSKNERVNSISELVRLSLESFAEVLVNNNQVEFVATHATALELLDRANLLPAGANKKNKRNLQDALANENLSLDALTTSKSPLTPLSQQPKTASVPEMDLALARMEELEGADLAARSEAAQERTEIFKDALGTLPED